MHRFLALDRAANFVNLLFKNNKLNSIDDADQVAAGNIPQGCLTRRSGQPGMLNTISDDAPSYRAGRYAPGQSIGTE
ncbi:MAG: hypothetical protein ABIS07_01385 [Dokdonella sp.]